MIAGAGMLADHTGLHLTYQRRQAGVVPLDDRLHRIELRLAKLETGLGQVVQGVVLDTTDE